LQKLYSELKDKGLELIAINHGDSADTITNYIKEGHFTFDIVMGGEEGSVFKDYGVQAFPTNYVLDPDGKVVWRGVGFDETSIRAALEKLGVK